MALIDLVDPDNASEEVREVYSMARHDNESPYRKAMLHNLEVLQARIEYGRTVLASGKIDEVLYEYVMVTVAQANACDYCLGSHRLKLMDAGNVPEDVVTAMDANEYSELDDDVRAVVEFAEQVINDPHQVVEDHILALEAVGFAEADIIQLLAVIQLCDMANTVVNTLNITPADRESELPLY